MDGSVLIERQQCVKIGDTVSNIGYPNGGLPQGTSSGPKNVLFQSNDLQTPCPIFKYVDDSSIFDVCNNNGVQFSGAGTICQQGGQDQPFPAGGLGAL